MKPKPYKYSCDTCGKLYASTRLRALRLHWLDLTRKYHNADGTTKGRQHLRHDVSRYVCASCIKKITTLFLTVKL